jgi:site-specific recombinase XerD
MKPALPTFPALLQKFFTQRLMQQKRVSAHTISSYRDTFRLLLGFAHKRLRTSPDRLAFEMIDAPFISAFLNELEKTRGVTTRTRNLRLTAIRSFFRFAAYEMPTHSAQIQRVLAMPAKRFDRKLIDFMTRPEVDALLNAPDKSTRNGRRDHALLLTTVQTGLRLSEVTGLKRQDITFRTGAHVEVLGKGRKQRHSTLQICRRSSRSVAR